jgi:integrase
MATVRKRKWTNQSGTHEAWVLSFTDASGKRHKPQFATKREAEAARIASEGQVASGTFRDTKDTVADACKAYLDHLDARHARDARVTVTYLASVRSELNYVAPAPVEDDAKKFRTRGVEFDQGIGDVALSKLTSKAVSSLTDRLLAAGVSVSAVRRSVASLSRALDHARMNDKVATNAARGVKVVGRRDEGSKKIMPPTREDMGAVLKAADPDFHARLLFAARSGLRAGEQWALRWHHLDLDEGEVTVETRVDSRGVEDMTKSVAGMRTVPIGKDVVAALQAWRKRSKFKGDDDLVFPLVIKRKAGDRATYTRHGNVYKRQYLPLLEKVGVSGFNWHSLRHYAVSQWIAAGLPIKVVQTYAGHATMAITSDRYGHLFATDSHRSKIDAIGEHTATA